MEDANFFITRLKANGSDRDLCNMEEVFDEYKVILDVIPANYRGSFSLNVLCTLCRNIDKIPSWSQHVQTKDLLILAIDCVRETRGLAKPDCIKTLACIYHIHQFVVKKNECTPPELTLKLAYMAFEPHELYNEHYKTYWCILVNRLTYMERLKTEKRAIVSLLPKFTKDLQRLMPLYDTIQFCTNNLTFVLKKLYFLYGDNHSKQLNQTFVDVFEKLITNKDLMSFKKLTEKEAIDLYVKFNEWFYIIAENSLKFNFENSALITVVRACTSSLGYFSDIFHCLQTFYLNSICSILTNNVDLTYTETVLDNLRRACESTEKLGYKKAMCATYPFLNHLLRIHIDYIATKPEQVKLKDSSNNQLQEKYLQLILFFMKNLKSTKQISKCEGCNVKSSMHDTLRTTFSIRNLITTSLSQDIDITNILPTYFKLIDEQYITIYKLQQIGCVNDEKYLKKLQTDNHNTAILLNKENFYQYSIHLFDIYIKNDIANLKSDSDLKNISRAFYNKGICCLDAKLYEDSLKSAYMSLIFSIPEGINSEKYMNLLINIKSNALKNSNSEEGTNESNQDNFQSTTALDICKGFLKNSQYGCLKPFFYNLKFSEILKHEFSMYAKLWPSIVPIAGIWRSLRELIYSKNSHWLKAENEDILYSTLIDIILETPTVVRSMHNEYFKEIIIKILENMTVRSIEYEIVRATLLFLKSDFDLNDASEKYDWKIKKDKIIDPDTVQIRRTVHQESVAIASALKALQIWTVILEDVKKSPATPRLCRVLQITQVFVPQMLHLQRLTEALQLAHICCELAQHVGDSEAFVRNAGTIFYHAQAPNEDLRRLLATITCMWDRMLKRTDCLDTMIVSFCDVAIYYANIGSSVMAAKIVQKSQSLLLNVYQKKLGLNLDLAMGRLMEAQNKLCNGPELSNMSAIIGTERHYLNVTNNATKWSVRRLQTLTIRYHISTSSVDSCALARSLQAWRRARWWASVSFPVSSALTLATLYGIFTYTHRPEDAQTKIKYVMKYILGIQTPTETQNYHQTDSKANDNQIFIPKQDNLETMLECETLKKTRTSPCLARTVPGYKTPELLSHDAKCSCYACENPIYAILTLQTFGLEASSYFRSNEVEIAKNYFDGVLNDFEKFEAKLKHFIKNKENKIENYLLDIVKDTCNVKLRNAQLEILIEATFFELSQKNNRKADENLVKIHEIIQEINEIDLYLKNDIMNLMTTSAHLRKVRYSSEHIGLEADFENLKLSPETKVEIKEAKTPANVNSIPPICAPIVVNQEEIPQLKCHKVIKFNLDEVSDESERETKANIIRPEFKMPIPKINKAVAEIMTPRTVSKTKVTQKSNEEPIAVSSKFETPIQKLDKTEFFTPLETPGDQFFTPMVTKTYSKRSTRSNVVKNLENEFSTPKRDSNKENTINNVAQNSEFKTCKTLKNTVPSTNHLQVPSNVKFQESKTKNNLLKRTTSPGKLNKDTVKGNATQTRSRRLRNLKLSVDEDDK